MLNNLGLCHNGDGIAPKFAAAIKVQRHITDENTKNAPNLNAFEMFIIAMLAKRLYES
ncbi:MAG: hypothetical protein FWE92_06260 [Defluviitaleaceae bacterium]|nr:hypothetical protein [Defluviitaleaceae bacterium]